MAYLIWIIMVGSWHFSSLPPPSHQMALTSHISSLPEAISSSNNPADWAPSKRSWPLGRLYSSIWFQ